MSMVKPVVQGGTRMPVEPIWYQVPVKLSIRVPVAGKVRVPVERVAPGTAVKIADRWSLGILGEPPEIPTGSLNTVTVRVSPVKI
jgi:hypothetical protein